MGNFSFAQSECSPGIAFQIGGDDPGVALHLDQSDYGLRQLVASLRRHHTRILTQL